MFRPQIELLHYGSESVSHVHGSHHQWVVGLEGALELEMAGHAYRNAAGRAVCIPAGFSHCYAGGTGNRQLVLNLPALGEPSPRQLDLPPAARELVLWAARHPLPDTSQPALAGLLLQWLAPSGFVLAPRLDRFLQTRLARPLAVVDMASACRLSPSHFHARLKAETGLSPMAYLTRMRMERAHWLLQSLHASVLDVALQVGYQSASAFSAAYRQHYGYPPGQGRARVRRS
ncbi:AraC family transcriptional regulator [Paludibacterium purpuratum]|uniref:AraC family transcriptional regulator n=2 Tax=Paludibacterium purpuratum TaxID=1144873 RepID=A0A4V3DUR5_9NEIS|nr:AraC family transcriptional regulator [Paludibacterium purpuratum]